MAESPVAVRAGHLALWTLVVVGAVSGVFAALRPAGTSPARSAGLAVQAPPEVAGFAEFVVRAWLEGRALDPLSGAPWSQHSERAGEKQRPPAVTSATTVAARAVDQGYWAVTVAATVAEADPTGSDAIPTWFLEVGILRSDRGLTWLGAPALVPAPVAQRAAAAPGPILSDPQADDPLVATSGAFLQALLAGTGDVGRYVAPGVVLGTVDPSPFATVTVQRAATVQRGSQVALIRVEALGTTPSGLRLSLSYELALEERAGRWEVRRVSGAPSLRRTDSPAVTPRPSPSRLSPTSSPVRVPGA